MTEFTIGRWLLVALAVVGLAFAAPVVSAHGNGPTADDAPPYDGTAVDWTAWMEAQMTGHMSPGAVEWMEAQMTGHMSPGAVEWMEAHMGVTIDEMARGMADGYHGHDDGPHGHDDGPHGHDDGPHGSGDRTHKQGHGC